MALRTCGRVNAANQISIIAGTSSTVAFSRVSCDGAILSGMLMPVRCNVFVGLVFYFYCSHSDPGVFLGGFSFLPELQEVSCDYKFTPLPGLYQTSRKAGA